MACKDCFNNCPDIVSDQCVLYTGPEIPILGICTGDQLSTFESKVAAALLTALDGTGILPSSVTLSNCPSLLAQFGNSAPNLNNILQLLINNNCTLNTLVASIQAQLLVQSGTVWDLGCLTGLDPQATSSQILQAVIFKMCQMNSTILAFPSVYVQNSDLTGLVTTIVNNILIANQVSGVAQQNAKMVPNVAYEYYGTLSNFDAGGIGIPALGFQKVYLCNGSNSTPDKRGRVAVGAVKNVPGGALDAAVDPSVDPNNPNWKVFDKGGENFHKLTVNEIPSHTHQVNDPQHDHNFDFPVTDKASGNSSNVAKVDSIASRKTSKASTGITLGATGGGQGHVTYQPSIAANYIMYIP